MTVRSAEIDAYLAALPDDVRETLEAMRSVVEATVPDAEESISYGMPAFKYLGRPLTYLGAARHHAGVYGMSAAIEAHAAELAPYRVSKGAIQVPIGEPLPEPLLRSLLRHRIAEIEAAAEERKKKRSKREA